MSRAISVFIRTSVLMLISALPLESVAQAAVPAGQDIVLAADTVGLRPGMTLAEARQKVAAYSGQIWDPEKTMPTMHQNFRGGPAPAFFARTILVSPNSTGPTFLRSTPPVGMQVGGNISLFVRDPKGDFRDESNLVIYDVQFSFTYRAKRQDNDVQTAAEYIAKANARFGPLKDAARKQSDRALAACMDVLEVFQGAEQRASLRSIGGETPYDQFPDQVATGRKCRNVDYILTTERQGQLVSASIRRFDFLLAEQALLNMTKVVGHEDALINVVMQQKAAKEYAKVKGSN